MSYVDLHRSGELARRVARARELLSPCRVCPRDCGADRLEDEVGVCGVGARAVVSSAGPHYGEEAPLVGRRGSGTVFFAGCNLRCVFCQNADISHDPLAGQPLDAAGLASVFLHVQGMGCHNLNLVSPTHVLPQVLEALDLAAAADLEIPLVWNCGGYESPEALALLDGIVDVYMPDLKVMVGAVSARLLDAPDYPQVARAALAEMHLQVGDLVVDGRGIATGGLLVRHLVLPEDLAGTGEAMAFLASLSADTYVNVMGQYRPCHHALRLPEIARRPTRHELGEARRLARDAGLHRLD